MQNDGIIDFLKRHKGRYRIDKRVFVFDLREHPELVDLIAKSHRLNFLRCDITSFGYATIGLEDPRSNIYRSSRVYVHLFQDFEVSWVDKPDFMSSLDLRNLLKANIVFCLGMETNFLNNSAVIVSKTSKLDFGSNLNFIKANYFICDACSCVMPKQIITPTEVYNLFLTERVADCDSDGAIVIGTCTQCYQASPCFHSENGLMLNGSCNHCPARSFCTQTILDYNRNPKTVIYGDTSNNELTFGMEIEIDGRGEDSGHYRTIRGDLKEVYAKHDGSLNDGFELVTQPMTYDYLYNQFDLKGLCKRAMNIGYRAHDTSTCGLHIHVSRKQLSDKAIANMVVIVNKNYKDFVKFSRRVCNLDYCRSITIRDYDDTPVKILGKDENKDKYLAVNLLHANSIEIRIFRGTLNYKTILASVQLVKNLTELCMVTPFKEANKKTLEDVVNFRHYSELKDYYNWVLGVKMKSKSKYNEDDEDVEDVEDVEDERIDIIEEECEETINAVLARESREITYDMLRHNNAQQVQQSYNNAQQASNEPSTWAEAVMHYTEVELPTTRNEPTPLTTSNVYNFLFNVRNILNELVTLGYIIDMVEYDNSENIRYYYDHFGADNVRRVIREYDLYRIAQTTYAIYPVLPEFIGNN